MGVFRNLVFITASALLVGCGGSSSASGPSYDPSQANVPACAGPSKAIALPDGFPSQFPFPSGTAITSRRSGFYGSVVIHGIIPSSSFQKSLTFFMSGLPKAGFKLTESDSEPPREGEAQYRGNGYVGRWKIHSIEGCPGALTLDVSATKS